MKNNLKKIGFAAMIFAASSFAFTSCVKKTAKVETDNDSIVVVEEVTTTKDYSGYTYEQKSEVVADAQAELDAINKRIDELKAEADSKSDLSTEAKANYDQAVKDLEKARDDYKTRVDELEKSTAETWEAAKNDIANAYNSAVQGIENTYNNAKDAINRGIDSIQSN